MRRVIRSMIVKSFESCDRKLSRVVGVMLDGTDGQIPRCALNATIHSRRMTGDTQVLEYKQA